MQLVDDKTTFSRNPRANKTERARESKQAFLPDILGNFLGGGRSEMLVRLAPELPERIPKPSDPCVARNICDADGDYGRARVHFVDDITWISENCRPVKGKE